jgi:hypothetical protein
VIAQSHISHFVIPAHAGTDGGNEKG